MDIENMRQLFEIGLRYVYDCEQKLTKEGIPSMIEAASSPELKWIVQDSSDKLNLLLHTL
jgi:ferritin-like metal-binding protein YciE